MRDNPATLTRAVLDRVCHRFPHTRAARSRLKSTIVAMAISGTISQSRADALIKRWGLRHD